VKEVLRSGFFEEGDFLLLFANIFLIGETENAFSEAATDDVFHADKCTSADEEDFLGVDLNVFLLRVLASSLRGDVASGAFEDFEKCLLNTLSRDITGDGDVFGFASDLVDLIDVDDAAFGAVDIEIGSLEETKDDILDIFANITRFSERGSIDDAKGNVKEAGESFGKESFAGTGWSKQEDVGFLNLNIAELVVGDLVLAEPLVMIVDCDGENFLRVVLTNDVVVEILTKFGGSGDTFVENGAGVTETAATVAAGQLLA